MKAWKTNHTKVFVRFSIGNHMDSSAIWE